jgi:hypothetical protein
MANKKPSSASKQERNRDKATPNIDRLLRAHALEIAAPMVEPLEVEDRDRVLELLTRILNATFNVNDRVPNTGEADGPHISMEGAA